MKCPYCEKDIYGMTGLQELQKFQKHLLKCKKNPGRATVVTPEGDVITEVSNADFESALKIRADSGQ